MNYTFAQINITYYFKNIIHIVLINKKSYDIIPYVGDMRMKKVYKWIPILLILAIGILSIRLFVVFIPQKAETADTAEGIKYLASLDKVDAKQAEETVRKAREKYSGAEQRKKIAKAIKEGNYEYAFQDIIIAGDSIVKAINEYGILSSSQVIAEVGAGTAYLEDVTGDIVAANPKYLILHFGENQLAGKDYADEFASIYGECIKTLKAKLPNTKIYVDSIFPVQEKAFGSEPVLRNIPEYNEAIKDMCKEIGVTFIDYDAMWASFAKNYYDLDGIHPVASFYKEQYLPYVLAEVGFEVDK